MPPTHTQSSQDSVEREGRILLAIRDLQNSKITSIRTAAARYQIPRTTLTRRLQNVQSRTDTRPNGHKLTVLEEDTLVEWILSLDSRGAAPRPSHVRDMANILLADRENTPPLTVGVNWATSFIKRRDELQSRFSRRYDYQRAKNEDRMVLSDWFRLVKQTIDQNGIQPDDIYNFDETGFAMGLISAQKVVTRSDLYGRQAILQPRNREWVTVVEAISAASFALPPTIIFKAKNHNKAWEEGLPNKWRIEVSPNGWTSDEITIRWLQQTFIPYSQVQMKGKYCLLILDGHGGHLTPQFDRICAENATIPLCMPAHSSHLLQPLDIGCFAVLKRAYSRLITNQTRLGHNYIDKLDFLAEYPQAHSETFKTQTIESSFRAAGLVPLDPDYVLSKLDISLRTPTPPSTRPSSQSSQFSPKTPKTVKQLQKQARSLKKLLRERSKSPPSPTKTALDQIIKGAFLSIHNTALLAQENTDLHALHEKKRQKRARTNRLVRYDQSVTIGEDLPTPAEPTQPVEPPLPLPATQVERPVSPPPPAQRAPPQHAAAVIVWAIRSTVAPIDNFLNFMVFWLKYLILKM